MRDKMSDTKVHVTDEQPWVAEGKGQHKPTTPKCTEFRTKMFTWSTTAMSRTRQESRNIERREKERKGRRIKDEEGGNEGKQRRGQKREGWGKQRKRESENVSGLKTKSDKKLISCIEGGKKIQQHIKAKAQNKGENYTMLTRWWFSGRWVGNALDWTMN